MRRLALIGLILTLAACGGQEGGPAGTSETDTPEVSAGSAAAVQGCLDLVSSEQYADAVPACLAALEQDPESQRAQAALDQARAGLAGIAAGAAELESGAADPDAAARPGREPATD